MLLIIIKHSVIIIFFLLLMEYIAWFTHKYVMHGFLWVLHEDHHGQYKGWWEKNSLFTFLKRIIKVHSVHHQASRQYNGRAYGFLIAGKKYD